ncbi:MAG: NAD(+) synthase [Schleiferiaceae bacterium]|nr:NAD(+) synthase [Schleiferiaceae bacterium]MDG1313302.1 NAD(+) synthase [Schleiferiaceae bacterium]MDG1919003.1 NAD(+) synthase [Schleiferiaceae bacterium]
MKLQETADHIINWLKNYAENAGVRGFVVGVSGGIDSALTSTLCARTGLEVLTLEMPIHQHPDQASRGQEHQNWLASNFSNTRHTPVDLTPVYDHFVAAMQPGGADHDLSLANSRARLRMSTLYYHGQANGLLVAGTGNKVEDFGVGFYTKYGDGGVDLSPIADLYKTEVFALARHLGIIESILTAQPTDGLWGDDRTDEDQLGASYPELEWAMEQQEAGKSPKYFSGREAEVMTIYNRFNTANKHKMLPIPVCEIPVDLKY